ncbi:MAG TPA: CGNR zinc finger domain-containing protein [Rhodococcus sp. (in: high G+C Gram-positive bacteria)]|jgi:predicted RNA-binding Zn ribbon-like protein|nr:CGNR zinc finger domain-containing protein [Rhodococcus sp. (in: high G+C Gram-positive bacteria)]
MVQDEDLLLALLNSAPIVDGKKVDGLQGSAGREFAQRFGGTGSKTEIAHLQQMRSALHEVIRDRGDAYAALGSLIRDAILAPEVTPTGIRWELHTPPAERLAVRAAMAWSNVTERLPGRLRPCANTECNLFLIDHSRPGSAKWCSMTTCGNRMKVRTHAHRRRER